ncbi:MAG: M28 family peptidase [Deltaproteobacteria bacterium]|nr:M28 family peptidase [Deltaproteobacteria bacterium]
MRATIARLSVSGTKAILLLAMILCIVSKGAVQAAGIGDIVRQFAALKDRSTGTEGCRQAADLISEAFKRLGIEKVQRQRFLLPVTLYQQARLSLPGTEQSLIIHPVELNAVSPQTTPISGLQGPLIYVGTGELEDFNGFEVKGSIVLMELDSGKNWINAAMLGAAAVVYLDRGLGLNGLYYDKFELTPIEFPRFWVPADKASELFGAFAKTRKRMVSPLIRLSCRGGWQRVAAENIYALIPGNDPELRDELLVVEAFYDSTSLVAGIGPGADEAVGIASLLDMARFFKEEPPGRTVLLVATSGHAQSLAGMRQFIWAIRAKNRELRKMQRALKKRMQTANKYIALLQRVDSLHSSKKEEAALLKEALAEQIKTEINIASQQLMKLRLQKGSSYNEAVIEELARRRLNLKRLEWQTVYDSLSDEERQLLLNIVPRAVAYHQRVLTDSREQLQCVRSAHRLRKFVRGKEIPACISLHLSSHGDGVGGFYKGWFYQLRPEVNMVRSFSLISGVLWRIAPQVEEKIGVRGLYKDTLRPNIARPWQSYFGDRPALGGEISTMAGMVGLTLVTLNDSRSRWGTPYDLLPTVNLEYVRRQSRLVSALIGALSREPGLVTETQPRNGFATLTGRANFIRQGELFPDQPAPGTVILTYQGNARFYNMVDTAGIFRIRGLADRKHVVGKAILEAYRFEPDTGHIIWAIDKRQTGKSAYRVKMRRRNMETDLVMFACRMTTLFDLLEPRTFRYLTKIKLLDAGLDAAPRRYFWSRIDTRSSTIESIFLERGISMKLTLSDTVLKRKLLLLNGDPDQPEGRGYNIDQWPTIPATPYRVAKDMWTLLLPRIANLENHGIFNEKIRFLQREGTAALEKAAKARAQKRYDRFLAEAKASWALALRVYNSVEDTQRDVLFGVLFYVALFVPFAYCAERLLFSYSNIHKRIIAFMSILAVVIGVIYLVHPAFQLTYSPFVVILAFLIVGLSIMVSLIIFNRFEQEMAQLQKQAHQLKRSEVTKGKAFMAAFVLGVSNLRRRKLRTGLTCVTLIILTFTIMSFTSVKSIRLRGRLRLADRAPYRGILLKELNWETLPSEAFEVMANEFGAHADVVPRGWMESDDRSSPFLASLRRGDRRAVARGVLGLSPREPVVSGIGRNLSRGRWFRPGELQVVVLPELLAQELGIRLGSDGSDSIDLWGTSFRVVGCFRGKDLERHRDLDGEVVTPVTFPSEAAVQITEVEMDAIESGEDIKAFQGRYHHIPADLTIILPYETLQSIGGILKAVAIKLGSDRTVESTARALVDRFGLTLFSGEAKGRFMYHASDSFSYSGVPNIIIPILISVLIVLNTMISSVYERKREIAVYTSVGLAPNHVSFLFVAESLAFAVLSAVLGYLLAQTLASLLVGTSLWHGITVNYSSLAGVAATVLVVLVVLISVIYPSRMAADIAIPDVNRAWTLPEPKGQELDLTLPFLVRKEEQFGIGGYLCEYYIAHEDVSHGLFSTDELKVSLSQLEGRSGDAEKNLTTRGELATEDSRGYIRVNARVWLAPFDFGVKQNADISFHPAAEDPRYLVIKVKLVREAGEATTWKRLNKGFLDDLRKQLLIWRSLGAEEKPQYEKILLVHVTTEAKGMQG